MLELDEEAQAEHEADELFGQLIILSVGTLSAFVIFILLIGELLYKLFVA